MMVETPSAPYRPCWCKKPFVHGVSPRSSRSFTASRLPPGKIHECRIGHGSIPNTIFWGDEHPFTSYFDVHQGYKVLTHCHMSTIQTCFPTPFQCFVDLAFGQRCSKSNRSLRCHRNWEHLGIPVHLSGRHSANFCRKSINVFEHFPCSSEFLGSSSEYLDPNVR